MAERRMFAKSIVLSDAFLDMPLGARCLYMTMGMLADDDGFVNSPKSIIRQCGASQDDLKVLIAKKFIIPFESGVIVIKHWRINNYLRNDRYQQTNYLEEKESLELDNNQAYKLKSDAGIPSIGIPSIGKDSIGKDSIGNSNIAKTKRFTPPTLEEITAYCQERNNTVDPKRFYDYYTESGWKDSSGKAVKNWKQKVITWENHPGSTQKSSNRLPDFENINGYNALEKKEPQMTPEEAKEWYDNLIKELEAENGNTSK